MSAELQARIEALQGEISPDRRGEARQAAADLLDALESGEVRAATPQDGAWQVHPWVKRGILLAFRTGVIVESEPAGPLSFADKDLLPPRRVGDLPEGVRIVPGGSAVRRGAHVGAEVTMMPPCYLNTGAYVGEGSMIDSHALVGSCAQVGRRVHVSAAAQIGGVLEPVGELPVIVEDEVLVGGNTGLYEGVLVRRRAVIGAGVILTRSTPICDLVHERILRADERGVLEVPEGAILVMGSRPARGDFAREQGLQIASPLLVKIRDERTEARTALEDALRP